MEERPLIVRIAEALGCKPVLHYTSRWWQCGCPGRQHDGDGPDGAPHEGQELERYDSEWSAIGPLIERYGLDVVEREPGLFVAGVSSVRGVRSDEDLGWPIEGTGPNRLLAVCELILALKSAGALEGATT